MYSQFSPFTMFKGFILLDVIILVKFSSFKLFKGVYRFHVMFIMLYYVGFII